MPILETDEMTLSQSYAIARYLARKFGKLKNILIEFSGSYHELKTLPLAMFVIFYLHLSLFFYNFSNAVWRT